MYFVYLMILINIIFVPGDEKNLDGDRHFIPYAVERENTDQNEESFDVYFAEFLKGNPDVKTIRSPQDMDNINKTWKYVCIVYIEFICNMHIIIVYQPIKLVQCANGIFLFTCNTEFWWKMLKILS